MSSSIVPVTPQGVRDGDPAVLAALLERRGGPVLAYCSRMASGAAVVDAAADAFVRFRASVLDADDLDALHPEDALLSAVRQAATARAPRPVAGGARGLLGRKAPCDRVPDLLVARGEGRLNEHDRELLAAHLDRCTRCRAARERLVAAERAYRETPPGPVPQPAAGRLLAAMLGASPDATAATAVEAETDATAAAPSEVDSAATAPPESEEGPAAVEEAQDDDAVDNAAPDDAADDDRPTVVLSAVEPDTEAGPEADEGDADLEAADHDQQTGVLVAVGAGDDDADGEEDAVPEPHDHPAVPTPRKRELTAGAAAVRWGVPAGVIGLVAGAAIAIAVSPGERPAPIEADPAAAAAPLEAVRPVTPKTPLPDKAPEPPPAPEPTLAPVTTTPVATVTTAPTPVTPAATPQG